MPQDKPLEKQRCDVFDYCCEFLYFVVTATTTAFGSGAAEHRCDVGVCYVGDAFCRTT